MITADLLTHVLVAFSVGIILSWRFKWISRNYITIIMLGAVLPDLTRIGLIIEPAYIENTFGVPFSWSPLHTIAGVFIIILLLTLVVHERYSKPVFILLVLGAFTHLFMDSFLLTTTGTSYTVFFPITFYNPPTPGFYLSTDMWPSMVSALAASVIWSIDNTSIIKEKLFK
ncbi:MAG: metal-dependent hydrolase [Candidatus Saliniplasma sp.]